MFLSNNVEARARTPGSCGVEAVSFSESAGSGPAKWNASDKKAVASSAERILVSQDGSSVLISTSDKVEIYSPEGKKIQSGVRGTFAHVDISPKGNFIVTYERKPPAGKGNVAIYSSSGEELLRLHESL